MGLIESSSHRQIKSNKSYIYLCGRRNRCIENKTENNVVMLKKIEKGLDAV